MITKLLLMFTATLAGLFTGLAFSNKLNERDKYFTQLVLMIDRLISDIKFSQKQIQTILSEYLCDSLSLNKNISEYISFIKKENTFNLSKGILSKRELDLIGEFFLRLGTLDLETQINELTAQKEVFTAIKDEIKEKSKKFSKAYIKLGVLGGLLVGILLL